MRAADDYAAIRARIEELQRERRQPARTVRDWKDDPLGPPDQTLIEQIKSVLVGGRIIRC